MASHSGEKKCRRERVSTYNLFIVFPLTDAIIKLANRGGQDLRQLSVFLCTSDQDQLNPCHTWYVCLIFLKDVKEQLLCSFLGPSALVLCYSYACKYQSEVFLQQFKPTGCCHAPKT